MTMLTGTEDDTIVPEVAGMEMVGAGDEVMAGVNKEHVDSAVLSATVCLLIDVKKYLLIRRA